MNSLSSPMRHRATRLLAVGGLAVLVPFAGAMNAHAAGTTHKATTFTSNYTLQAAFYNDATGKCADLPNYGSNPPNTPVTQYNCNLGSGDNQMWDFQPTRVMNGTQLFEFVNDKSGLCMDLPNYGSDPAGTHVYTYYCNSNPAADNQEFYLNDVSGNGDYEVVNYSDGLCLDVSGWASNGSDLANNLPLTVYPCYNSSWANGGYDDHLWELHS